VAFGEDELIDGFYAAVVAPERWGETLDDMRRHFTSVGAVLAFRDPATPLSLGVGAGVWQDDVLERYARDYAAVDPAPARFARVPLGKVASSMELIPADEARRDVFFNEFYSPAGLAETLGGPLAQGSGCFGLVGLHRDSKRAEFDRADAARLERLIPHIARSFSLQRAFARLQIQAAILASVVDRLSAGVIVLDWRGRSMHVNETARKFVARKDGLFLTRAGRLRAANRVADRALAGFQDSVPIGQTGGLVQIPRDGEGKPYVALVAPLPGGTGIGATGEGRVGVLILVHDQDASARPPARTLAAVFGLTPKAAELTAALAAGEELKDYAERTGVTLHTARFHLKVAFIRTGVRSQTQLVRLAVRALADLHF
jgi:DNA-binding CsgD family transcriptional regulator/PAS domain-containing protein